MKTLMNLATVAAITLTASAAQGAIVQYAAYLDGPSVEPPNSSTATGTAMFDYDTDTHLLTSYVSFSGLQGTTTVAHIHANTTASGTGIVGVALPFAGWTTGLQAGSYSSTVSLLSSSSYSPTYLADRGGSLVQAESDLLAALTNGRAYVTIHSNLYPGGEIRGFVYQVPAPGMLPLAGMCGFLTRRRRR